MIFPCSCLPSQILLTLSSSLLRLRCLIFPYGNTLFAIMQPNFFSHLPLCTTTCTPSVAIFPLVMHDRQEVISVVRLIAMHAWSHPIPRRLMLALATSCLLRRSDSTVCLRLPLPTSVVVTAFSSSNVLPVAVAVYRIDHHLY